MAGAALVSSGLLINLSHAGLRTQPADAELTAVQCALGDTLCSDTTVSLVAAPKAAATAATANPITDILGIFIGNGTMTHPNAGLLIGNGYSYTENDIGVPGSPCEEGKPCNGGNAGLLFGNGGNGWDGGNGGNAYIYGKGGNGGNAVDFGLAGEDNFGGNGGNGGIFGGTDSNGALFRAGGGDGGNGLHGGTGGNGGNAGWGLNLAPALADRVFGGLFGK